MVPAEILERREVLSGTPITLAQAQTDAAAAQTALNGAVSSYIASMVTLEGQLESETAAHQATFTGSATTAVGFFETAVDGINLNLKNALDPLSLGLSNDTQQIEDDLADDQQDAQDIFNTASATASGIFDAAVIGIDLGFQGDLDAADFDFNGTSTTENGTLDGVINTAEDDFDDAATQADSDFNDTVTDEQSDFDDAEQDNNDDYEDAIDDSPTGFGGIFNTTITGLESTRDGVLASHPNATWDPNVLDPTAVQGVQDGADAIFDSGLQGLIDTFETNVQTLQGTFNDASADAYEFFNDAIEIADQARTDAIADANSDFEDDMSGPRDTHATNMQTILGTFNDAITLATGVRDDARQAAQDAFDSVVDPAITTAEDAIADAQQDYYDWLSGTGANSISKVTWSRTKTVDTSVTPTSVTWSESGTTTSSNGDSSYWKGREQSWMPRLPQGAIAFGSPVVVVLGTVTATTEKFILPLTTTGPNGGAVGNVFDVALRARFDAYVDELDEIEDVYNDAVEQANLARDAAVLGANGTYLTSVYGNAAGLAPFTSGTPAEVFQTAQTAASTAFSQAEGGEFQDYSNAVSGYYMSLMQVIMDPSNMTMTMPDPAVIGGFGQTYLVNSLNAAIDYTQTVGAAWVTFVGAERAADSTRDSSIVLAEYNAARDTENAANTADLGAIDAWNGWAQDSLKIGADFTKEAASKAETRDNKIVTAIKTAVLVVNGQAQIQAKANVVADTTFADSQSGAWDDRIQDEATEDKILTKAAATAEETRTNAIATADGTHASSSADAGESLSNDLSQATVDLEGGLAGEENAMTSGALGLVTTWVSTVAAGIDHQILLI